MEQNNDIFNEYETTIDMIEKYIVTNNIQVTMAETRFYKNLAMSKKKADEQKFNNPESMVMKSARFRIYNNDSGAVYSHAEKVRKAEQVKDSLEEMKKNSPTKYELNKRFKEWKENNANYTEIMVAIGEAQIESLHTFGLSLDKLTSQKEGFKHVKDILENAVKAGKIASGQVMSYKLGTWHYLSVPDLRAHIGQKQNEPKHDHHAASLPHEAERETAAAPEKSTPKKDSEALLAAEVTLEKIIKRCGYPAGTPVKPSKIIPLLDLAESKGFITKEERPIFEKTLQPLIGE